MPEATQPRSSGAPTSPLFVITCVPGCLPSSMVSSSSRNNCRVFLVSPELAKQGLAALLEVCSVNSSANQFPLPRLCLSRSPHLDVLPRLSAGSGPLSLHCLSLQGSPWAFPECTCASFPVSLAPNEVHIPRCPGLASFRPSSKCQPVLHRKMLHVS